MKTNEYKYLCYERLFRLRKVMMEKGYDGFLIILGIDSRFNTGCFEAVKYLLPETSLDNFQNKNLTSEILGATEEFVMLVKLDSIHCFCTDENCQQFLKALFTLSKFVIYQFSDPKKEDPDGCEDMKVKAFRKMTASCKNIAIPYYTQDEHNSFDKLQFERWPLIQSYACNTQDGDDRTFFTLAHKVGDFSLEMHKLNKTPDPLNFEAYILKNMLILSWAFDCSFQSLDRCDIEALNTGTMIEPLWSYFKHAQLFERSHNRTNFPFLLMGCNTTYDKLKIVRKKSSEKTFEPDFDAMHFIINGSSSILNAQCTRTYMITPSSSNTDLTAQFQSKFRIISTVQKILLMSLSEIITGLQFKSFSSNKEIIEDAQLTLKKRLSGFIFKNYDVRIVTTDEEITDLPVRILILRAEVRDLKDETTEMIGSVAYADTFLLSTIEVDGEHISTNVTNLTKDIAPFGYWDLHNLSAEKKPSLPLPNSDIQMALIFEGINEYSVVPGSFNFESGKIKLWADRMGSFECNVNKLDCFSTDELEFWNLWHLQVERSHFDIAPAMAVGFTAEESKRFMSKLGNVEMKDLKGMSIFFVLHRGTTSHEALLKLKENSTVRVTERTEIISIALLNPKLNSILSNNPYRGRQHLSHSSLMQFKRSGLSLALLQETMGYCQRHLEASLCMAVCHGQTERLDPRNLLQHCGIFSSSVISSSESFRSQLRKCLDVRELSEASGVAPSVLHQPDLTSDQLRMQQFGLGDKFENTTLPIMVLCGLHGSHMDEVANGIVKMSREGSKLIVMRPRNLHQVKPCLSSALQEKHARESKQMKARCLLIAPEFTSMFDVLTALNDCESCKANEVESLNAEPAYHIVCSIICVDTRFCYLGKDGFLLPGLNPFFELGWTNLVLITNPIKIEHDLICKAIRLANKKCVILDAPGGRVRDLNRFHSLLDNESFDAPDQRRHRLLTVANYNVPNSFYRLMESRVEFKLPLDKNNWKSALTVLKGTLSPFSEAPIVLQLNARIEFLEDSENVHFITYWPQTGLHQKKLIKKLSTTETKPRPFLVTARILSTHSPELRSHFTGCDWNAQDKLDEWVRNWILEAVPKREIPKPLINATDLDEKTLEQIHDMAHLKPMPKGWYYTGSEYVHIAGDRSYKHPCFEDFIQDYVTRENKKITDHNEWLSQQPVSDLFD